MPSTSTALGRAKTQVLGVCSPWLLGQKGMQQRGGAAGSIPLHQGAATGMLWAPLSYGPLLPFWESWWPGTWAKQPPVYCMSFPCLSFPITTNSLGVGDTFAKQNRS